VLAAQTLPLAVLILAAGVWADRLNRRNVMIVSDLGRALRVTFAGRPSEHHFWADLKGGIAEVTKRNWMWTFMPGFSAYHLLALPCVLALGPVIADRELDGASSWAAITACFGIGTIAGSVLALRTNPRHPMYGATLAFIVASCQALVIAYGNSTVVIAALQVLTGVAVAYGFTLWDTSLGREIPAGALSRVTSLDWFTTTGTMPVGFALVAPAAELFGTRLQSLTA
jgi:hypothetical protein